MDSASREPIRLTRSQVREIDRRAVKEYHIPGIVLMENAALAVTQAALEMLRPARHGGAVIVCGGGNNGGDGLAVARHLHNRGVSVEIALAVDPEAYKGDARINWQIIKAMGLKVTPADETESALARGAGLIVDALFGTGLSAPPRDPRMIELMNKHGAAVLAVDLPSGLDCDTGEPLGPACVRAARPNANTRSPLSRPSRNC